MKLNTKTEVKEGVDDLHRSLGNDLELKRLNR